ncbi:MAG: Flp pilus assembly complex ATPase component TadA [Elusimicrobia bacterium]|nr:Flp pilus assembly complex ATPase component TadA [Elusimicrobiota bacterium]
MIRLRIGDVLLEQGLINQEQLDRALTIQKQTGGMLGEILVKNGFVSEEQLTKALSRQFGLPFASRANGLLTVSDKEALKSLIPQDFARSHHLAPLFVRDETLGVAVADPMDVITMDNLRILTGKNLMVYLAMRTEIGAILDSLYGGGQGAADFSKIAQEASAKANVIAPIEEVGEEEKADLDKNVAQAGETKVVQLVNEIIRQAIEERASDIHIEPMEDLISLRFRIDGVLHEKPPPAKILGGPMVSRIKILSKLNVAERRLPQDGSFAVKHKDNTIDMRVSSCPTVFGEKVVVRILSKQAVELDVKKIGMEPKQQEDFLKAAAYPHGLILLTGPTGSGKTTTLYSILKAIQAPDINIMTIEDPVEFQIRGLNQVQVKPQIGLTFSAALRSFLRQDPDVILVGEVRDLETAELCIRAALTGHLVLSTLHTNDALSAALRLKDLGVEPFLVSSTLVLLAAQRLVRMLCKDCKQPYTPDKAQVESLGLPYKEPLFKAKGCLKCSSTGYMGRKAIYEIILTNDRLRTAIHQNLPLQELRKLARDCGFMTMKESGYLKVQQGLTSLEEYLATVMIED